jgi:hypothetical protein
VTLLVVAMLFGLELIASDLVSVVAALVVFSSPGDSLVLLARIGGVILLLFGVVVTPVLGVRQAKQEPGGRPHLSAAH